MKVDEKTIKKIVQESFAKIASRMGPDKLKQSTIGTQGTPPPAKQVPPQKSDFEGQEIPDNTPFAKKKIEGLTEAVINRIAQIIMEELVSAPQKYDTTHGGDNGSPASKQTKNYNTNGAQVEPAPKDGETPQAQDDNSGGDSGSPANKQTKGQSGASEPAPTDGDTPQKLTFESKKQMEGVVRELTERVIKSLKTKK